MSNEALLRGIWLICVGATLWFALVPPQMGGLGGAGYHGVAFMVLGLLTPAAFPRLSLLLVWFALLALGGAIEVGQEFTDLGRSGEWADMRFNTIAATVGVIYAWIGRVLIKRVRNEKASSVSNGSSD
ncbi:VanZ family protein [Aurantiacibacter sp. D1-12]|uniref:VanZ family protein n=1 Tax=Aurantiacibacter sp. D1-12 TaxID=2993658 RepID=UPI00237C9598|nr:VanZ family protein [Aurantiacibacter sp. D1-12]MDE1468296.1 VanZ family protein [Aurantiacibacter sp. D1-12]